MEHSLLRYLRINVRFLNASDRAHNYDGEEAIRFAKDLIDMPTRTCKEQQTLAALPQQPTGFFRYQYQLSPQTTESRRPGNLFSYDDRLCYYIHKGSTANLFGRSAGKIPNRRRFRAERFHHAPSSRQHEIGLVQ
ncbi:MAG: hypothetical protein IPO07_05515 [Haliscomenobacter sp.]|nr:hypothetical protein [Haliscomenobacter sp.]MBK9488297.1 hypothetical protein [Haliscomenobacter sp.]